MQLLSINFTNFRRFKEETINFNSGINLFVGPNNAGKSTIIEAISIAFGFGTKLGAIQLNKEERTGTCSFILSLKFNADEWKKSLLLLPVEQRDDEHFPNLEQDELFNNLSEIPLNITWRASYAEGRRTSERRTLAISDEADLSDITPEHRPFVTNAIVRLRGQNLRVLFDTITVLPVERRIQSGSERILYYNDFVNRQEDIKNVRNRLFHVKQRTPELYLDLRNKILEVFNFQDFDVELDFNTGNVEFTITRGDTSFDLNEMGSGTQSFILLFSHIYLSGLDVAIIDEPEVNLHASLVKKLADFLRTISETTQLILTSHNEVFIKEFELNETFRVEYLNEPRQSKVQKLDYQNEQDSLLEMLGVDLTPLDRAETRFSNIKVFCNL